MITTSLYALHYISGFFIIMSPAEGLHFSALVTRGAWAATGIVVCWSVCYPRRVGGHGYSSLLVCLLTRGAWAATGYSSRLVCLFVCDR